MIPLIAQYNHSKGAFTIGDEFTLQGIKVSECRCAYTLYDIGLRHKGVVYSHCAKCGELVHRTYGIRYFHSGCFIPLSTIESAIKEICQVTV